MKTRFLIIFTVLFMVFFVGGCRSGRYDLTTSQLKPAFQGTGQVAIGVQDKRPFILDGTKASTYIGIHRNGVGVPTDVGTRSGKTLAEDVATVIASSFTAAGFEPKPFALSPSDELESSLKRLVPSACDRIVIFTLEQFRSDSWAEVELQWAITMRVYDGQGKLLAEKDNVGKAEGLKRNYAGSISAGQAQSAISAKLSAILGELINAPECQRAIVAQGSPAPAETPSSPQQAQEATESQPTAPPVGFIWKSYKDVRFPKPEQWREQQIVEKTAGLQVATYATSPKEFSIAKQFETGFTIQIINGSKKIREIEATKMALLFLKPFLEAHPKEDVLMFDQSVKDGFEQIFFRYKDAPPGLTPIIVHKFVLASNVTDSVHVFTFESPMASWEENWGKYGTPILSKINLLIPASAKKISNQKTARTSLVKRDY